MSFLQRGHGPLCRSVWWYAFAVLRLRAPGHLGTQGAASSGAERPHPSGNRSAGAPPDARPVSGEPRLGIRAAVSSRHEAHGPPLLRRAKRHAHWNLLAMIALTMTGCFQKDASTVPVGRRSPVEFSYYAVGGAPVSSASLRGRVTAVLFVTTYDSASQLEVQELQGIVRRHVPRINALVVVLEQPQYASLLPVYAESLGLTIPVAIADYATLSGEGPFGRIARVPTLVLLDRQGAERWRAEGTISGGTMARQVRALTGDRH